MKLNSLRSKINIAIFSAYIIVALSLLGIYIKIEKHLQENRGKEVKASLHAIFIQNMENLANDVFNATEILGTYESGIQQRIKMINDVNGVEQVAIFDKNGKFLLAYKHDELEKDKDKFCSFKEDSCIISSYEKQKLKNLALLDEQKFNNNLYLVYSSEIQFLGEVYGYIKIYYSLKNLKNEQLLARVTFAASLVVILLVLLGVQNILLYRGIIELTEEALRESEAKYRGIFENALDGIFRSVPEGRFIEVNPSMARILGYESPAELIEKVCDIRGQLYVNHKHRDEVFRILHEKDVILNYETEFYRKDSSIICVLLQIKAFRNKEGELLYLEGLMVDITERKQATAEELQQSEQKYRRLYDSIRDGYIETAREGLFIDGNPSFCEMLGYSLEELKTLNYSQVRHPIYQDTEKRLLRKQLREKGYSDVYEVEYIRKNGETFPVEVRAYAIMDEQANLKSVWGFIRDITYKMQLQAELIRNARLASLGELAARVAHEINNPINGVINYAQILINEAEKNFQNTEILKRIIKEGDRIDKIVRNLLSFARKDKKDKRLTSLKKIIEESMELMLLKKDNIEVMLDIDSELSPINANPWQLGQVFVNIISNARHALKKKISESGEAKVFQITTALIQKKETSMVRVTCYDNGVGIAPNVLDRICDPFFSTKSERSGTGLGLSISHGIIQDHEGELSFESVEGKHTKVIIDLPLQT